MRENNQAHAKERSQFYIQHFQSLLKPEFKALEIGASAESATVLSELGAKEVIGTNIDGVENFPCTLLIHDANTHFPFEDNHFDIVVMFSVLEHLKNQKGAIRESFRVLSDNGGLLVIQIPNPYFPIDLHFGIPFFEYFPNFLRWRYYKMIDREGYDGYKRTSDIFSLQYITAHKGSKIMKESGFSIVRKQKLNPLFLIPSKFQKVSRILSKLGFFSVFPIGYLIVGQKDTNQNGTAKKNEPTN